MGHFSYLSYEIINLRALVSISQTIWNVLPNCGQSQASVCLWSFALAILSTWHTWPMQCLATDLCFSLALRAAFFDLYWRSPLPHPGYFLSHYPALLSPYHLSPVEIIFFKTPSKPELVMPLGNHLPIFLPLCHCTVLFLETLKWLRELSTLQWFKISEASLFRITHGPWGKTDIRAVTWPMELINDGLSACGLQAPEGLGPAELRSGGHSRREGRKGSKIPIVIWVTLEFWKLSGWPTQHH